jgi:parallel beta-helix repeat protein
LSGCLTQVSDQQGSILYVGFSSNEYPSIHAAIDHAQNGSIIQIASGIFYETLIINKSIQLIGSRNDSTIIYPERNYSEGEFNTIDIAADNCTIQHIYVIKGNAPGTARGIVIQMNNTTIMNTTVQGFSRGIVLEKKSSHTTITDTLIINNSYGIDATQSTYNIISHNQFSLNSNYAIYFELSNNNVISQNFFTNNSDFAVRFKASYDNNITENYFSNNTRGLYFCCGSNNNLVDGNNFINNTEFHASEATGNINFWYSTTPPLGNYWDDYNGTDIDGDGIGETFYPVTMNDGKDMYPLITARTFP